MLNALWPTRTQVYTSYSLLYGNVSFFSFQKQKTRKTDVRISSVDKKY